MPFHGFIGSIGPVARRRSSQRALTSLLLRTPDRNRRVRSGRVTNSPLGFKQSSFIRVIQVLGSNLCLTVSQVSPFPTCYGPNLVSLLG